MKRVLVVTAFLVFFSLVFTSSIFAYGNNTSSSSTSESKSMPTAPQCTAEKPNRPVLYEPNHPLLPRSNKAGEIILKWLPVASANKYLIAYGVSPRNYIYGAPDVGNVDQYTVRGLTPGQTYYFSVKAINDCMPSDYSNEWGVKVSGNGMAYIFQNVLGKTTVQAEETEGAVLSEASEEANMQITVTPQETQKAPEFVPVKEQNGNLFQRIWRAIKSILGIK